MIAMSQLSTGDQMTLMLVTIENCLALNNKQSPYHVASYKSPDMTKYQTVQMRKPTA